MKDHNDYLPKTIEWIDSDLEALAERGDTDSKLNYLYFLRDGINKRIKEENKKRKGAK